jgi:hypothetical protein
MPFIGKEGRDRKLGNGAKGKVNVPRLLFSIGALSFLILQQLFQCSARSYQNGQRLNIKVIMGILSTFSSFQMGLTSKIRCHFRETELVQSMLRELNRLPTEN